MAHFAELDDSNRVLQVVVISNVDLLDNNGLEDENLGIEVCKNIFGSTTRWVQTSYNNNFRKKFACVGDIYESNLDLFYSPTPPHESWTLDSNYDWISPIPKPDTEGLFIWDDSKPGWVNLNPPLLPDDDELEEQ